MNFAPNRAGGWAVPTRGDGWAVEDNGVASAALAHLPGNVPV